MSMATLDLSVLLVLRRPPFQLQRSLASVRLQTPQPREVLVTDDGSGYCPRLDSVIHACGLDVRLLRLTPGSGGSAIPRNHGLAVALGHYVAFLDAGDVWLPGHLAALERSWSLDPGAIVHGDQLVWGPEMQRPFLQQGLPTQMDAACTFEALRRRGNQVFLSSVAGPRQVLASARFDEDHRWEDFDLWLRLSKRGQAFRHSGHCGTLYCFGAASRSAGIAARRQGARRLSRDHFSDVPWWRWPRWLQRNFLPF
jgi:glycosyltransferase involved in cell wall biosynthesis